MRSNLSVNVGLRWEYRRPPFDKHDVFVAFYPLGPKFSGPGNGTLVTAAPNAVNDALCLNDPSLLSATGQCLVTSSSQRSMLGFTGRRRRAVNFGPGYKDFAPRLGISWRPSSSNKLVVHTGFGVFYDLPNTNSFQSFNLNNPVFTKTPVYNTAFGSPPPLTNGIPTTVENMFLSATVPPLSQTIAELTASPFYRTPRVLEWSFGIESQLAQNWALEVDYVGNRGSHLDTLHLFANQPEPGVGPLQPRRPYPDFNIMLFDTTDSNSFYHGLQAKLTKRFSSGFSFLTSYTFGHTLSDNEGDVDFAAGTGNAAPQDDNNLRADYGRTPFDARQRLVFSAIWQLPFGKDRHFLNRGGIVNGILGGWELSNIITIQSGLPFSVLSTVDFANTGTLNPRPDRVCNGQGPKTVSSWFSTSCFTTTSLEQALAAGTPRFGNSGRNILEGPGLNNWDISLLKRNQIGEHLKLEFRAEFFNIFNQAHFGAPNSSIGSATVGQIAGAGSPRDIQFGLKLSF